jgi:hypothetical protein
MAEQPRHSSNGVGASPVTPQERMAIGSEAGTSGHRIGRDPRRMTQDELRATGHKPMSATAAIRAHCLDCCAGSADEVRKCMALACPSWPWRTGVNPWRAPVSEARREHARTLADRRRRKIAEQHSICASGSGTAGGGTPAPYATSSGEIDSQT